IKITVTQKAEPSGNSDLTQQEIIDLLTAAHDKYTVAEEYELLYVARTNYSSSIFAYSRESVAYNRVQKKALVASYHSDTATVASSFDYIEGQTRYVYNSSGKSTQTVSDSYWNNRSFYSGIDTLRAFFSFYEWTTTNNVTFAGTRTGQTDKMTVTIDSNKRLTFLKMESNQSGESATKEYNIGYVSNPAFPKEFSKSDFENPLAGKVRTINGEEVHYTENGFVSGVGDFDINEYVWKSGFGLGFLDYIDIPNGGSRFDYFRSNNNGKSMLDSITYYPTSSWDYYFISRYTWNAGNLSRIRGDQRGVSRFGELVTTFEYTDTEYAKSNLDISFLLASGEYYVGPSHYFVAFDNNNCIRTKKLISKRIQNDEDGDKYDLTETYTYEFNDESYVTSVQGDKGASLTFEYY
ncbi:MAG: hypothetical protein LBS07_00440, partial [Prevotellaceae bacterium]|nr:hypothetical protein [Prevotellaceae bacterium]